MTRVALALVITFFAVTALTSWWAIDVFETISCAQGGDCYTTPQWEPTARFGVTAGGVAAFLVLATWAVLQRHRSPR